MCPNFWVFELAPTTAKNWDEKNVLMEASVLMLGGMGMDGAEGNEDLWDIGWAMPEVFSLRVTSDSYLGSNSKTDEIRTIDSSSHCRRCCQRVETEDRDVMGMR